MTHLTTVYRAAMDTIEHVDAGDSIETIADVIDGKAVEPLRAKLKECLGAFNYITNRNVDHRGSKTTYELCTEIDTLLKQFPKR